MFLFLVGTCGSVGVGKTSTIGHVRELLAPKIAVHKYFEPIEVWRDFKSPINPTLEYNPLDEYYKYPQTLFRFQTVAQTSYLREMSKMYAKIENSGVGGVLITERTPMDAMDIFTKMGFNSGLITAKEYTILDYISETWKENLPKLFSYDLLIHLTCPAEIQFERINKRKRPEEEGQITLELLTELTDQYEKWFDEKRAMGQKVATIQCEDSPQLVSQQIEAVILKCMGK